jgi:hypothetical protein
MSHQNVVDFLKKERDEFLVGGLETVTKLRAAYSSAGPHLDSEARLMDGWVEYFEELILQTDGLLLDEGELKNTLEKEVEALALLITKFESIKSRYGGEALYLLDQLQKLLKIEHCANKTMLAQLP